MTEEERQRQMDFILNQQAQFVVGIGQLKDQTSQMQAVVSASQELVTHLAAVTNAGFKSIMEQISRLAEAQGRTDERLNILISTVERFIGGRWAGPNERPL